MGGTTAEIRPIEDRAPRTARTFEVARTYRFRKGSGMPISSPITGAAGRLGSEPREGLAPLASETRLAGRRPFGALTPMNAEGRSSSDVDGGCVTASGTGGAGVGGAVSRRRGRKSSTARDP